MDGLPETAFEFTIVFLAYYESSNPLSSSISKSHSFSLDMGLDLNCFAFVVLQSSSDESSKLNTSFSGFTALFIVLFVVS
jgi:hypothetical protein